MISDLMLPIALCLPSANCSFEVVVSGSIAVISDLHVKLLIGAELVLGMDADDSKTSRIQ